MCFWGVFITEGYYYEANIPAKISASREFGVFCLEVIFGEVFLFWLCYEANFKNVGVFSNIYLRATGKNASNEKRIIKLSQSAPFKPNINGRPPK